MKIQPSDIGRFLQLACKMWNSNNEDDSQIVVFTFTESCCSIEMARDGLLLTYLCNRVDAETNEKAIAVPFEFLRDCSIGTGVVGLQVIIEIGERRIAVKWREGLLLWERSYPVQELPKYHLLPDLAWHTVDERMGWMRRATATETHGGERAFIHREYSRPIATVPR